MRCRYLTRPALRVALVALVAGVQIAGCGLPTQDPTPVDGAAQAYLLRGLWDLFSLGLNDLAAQLRERGVDAVAVSGPTWPELSRSIAGAHANQTAAAELILVGHSYGADDAVNLCRSLGGQGISVKLLVLLDATNPAPIPANVDRCIHYYLPNQLGGLDPGVYPGNPVVPATGNTHTVIVNQVFSTQIYGPGARDVNHFNIDKNTLIHRQVTADVLTALGPDQPVTP
jgi:hypothetical protein